VTSFSYTYDANKNKTAETIGGVMQPYGYSATYDDEDRLATWTRDDSNLTQSWNLSPVGDWSSFTENTVVENRTHGPTHELTAVDSTPLTYDAKGNLTGNANGQTYTWDFDNRMRSATVSVGSPDGVEGTHTYTYDALGRRVAKSVEGSASVETTVFVSTTQRLKYSPHAGQIVSEYASGAAAASPDGSFIYGAYIDEHVLLVHSPGASESLDFYHANSIHSVAAISDDVGEVVERHSYSAYGSGLICDGAGVPTGSGTLNIGRSYAFTGRRLDHETGLHYYRARFYSNGAGRFTNRDPIAYDGSRWNLYAYTGSSPLIRVDPSGETWVDTGLQFCNGTLHGFLMLTDGVGYGLYADSHIGGDANCWDDLATLGIVDGHVQDDDATVYSHVPCADVQVNDYCWDVDCYVRAVETWVRNQMNKRYRYNVLLNNCYTWRNRACGYYDRGRVYGPNLDHCRTNNFGCGLRGIGGVHIDWPDLDFTRPILPTF
jgi:RHS repeat-associated protein